MNTVLLLALLAYLIDFGVCIKLGENRANENKNLNENATKCMSHLLESEAAGLNTTRAIKVAGPTNSSSDFMYTCGCGEEHTWKHLVEHFKKMRKFTVPCSKCNEQLSLPDLLAYIERKSNEPVIVASENVINDRILSLKIVNTLIGINAQIKDLRISPDQTTGTFEIGWAGKTFEINIDNQSYIREAGIDVLNMSMMMCGMLGNIEYLKVFISLGADINVAPKNRSSLLHIAMRNKNIILLMYLISIGIDLEIETEKYGIAIHYALHLDDLLVLRLLLNAGANLESVDKTGKTILTKAIETNNLAALALLSNYYPSELNLSNIIYRIIETDDAEAMGKVFSLSLLDSNRLRKIFPILAEKSTKIFEYFFTKMNFSKSAPVVALYHAIKADRMDNVEFLKSRGYDLKTCNNGTYGVLAYAIIYNDEVVAKKLLELGIELTDEIQLDKVMTEMIKKGNPNMVKLIFSHGMNRFEDLGLERVRKSLVFACKIGNLSMIEELFDQAGPKYAMHRLNAAFMSKNEEIFINFLNRGFVSRLLDGNIHWFLHYILMEADRPRSIETILQKGANVYLEPMTEIVYEGLLKAIPGLKSRLTCGNSAVVTALICSRFKSMEVFLRYGYNPNTRIFSGTSTLLHLACELKNVEMARLLINYGADTNALDINNKSPFAYIDNPEILRKLQNMNEFL